MKVRATRLGYYDHKRRYPAGAENPMAGQPFDLARDSDFSELWMEKVGADGKPLESEKQAEQRDKVKDERFRADHSTAAARERDAKEEKEGTHHKKHGKNVI